MRFYIFTYVGFILRFFFCFFFLIYTPLSLDVFKRVIFSVLCNFVCLENVATKAFQYF